MGSISGGTDIIACFMGENSVLPVHRGEIQSAHLGCAIECWSDDGMLNDILTMYSYTGQIFVAINYVLINDSISI